MNKPGDLGKPATPSTLLPVRHIDTQVAIPESDVPLYETVRAVYKVDDKRLSTDAVNAILFLYRNGYIGGNGDFLAEIVSLFSDLRSLRERVITQLSRTEKLSVDACALLGGVGNRVDHLVQLQEKLLAELSAGDGAS